MSEVDTSEMRRFAERMNFASAPAVRESAFRILTMCNALDRFRADADALAREKFAMNAYCDVPAGECAAAEYRALEQARKATEPALARARERGVKP